MCELFLKKANDEYSLYVLGKNGEARADTKLQVTFIHKWFANPSSQHSSLNQPQTLTTDKEGKVKLGKLRKICAIMANAPSLHI